MISLKRGNTFVIPKIIFWKDKTKNNEEPQDLTGVTIRSSLKKGSTLVAELVPTVIDAFTGEFSLGYGGTTRDWPVGLLSCDIEFTLNTGQIISTATFNVEVTKNVT